MMQEIGAGLVIVGMFLLRLGIPVAVTVGITWWLRRLDARWRAEAQARQEAARLEERLQSGAPMPARPSALPCWMVRNCSEEKRQECPAGQGSVLPCWVMRLRREGRLPSGCVGCELFGVALPQRH